MTIDDHIRDAFNHPALVAQRKAEEQAVRELGRRIGYGRVMQLGQQLWRELVIANGVPGSEFVSGPCAGLTVKCPCQDREDSGGHCDWCCGAG